VRNRSAIPLAAHILRVSLDFDRLRSRGLGQVEALKVLQHHDEVYCPEVVTALARSKAEGSDLERRCLFVDELKNGMILDEEVTTADGMLLVPKGLTINDTIRQRLRNFRLQDDIAEKVWVRVPDPAVLAGA